MFIARSISGTLLVALLVGVPAAVAPVPSLGQSYMAEAGPAGSAPGNFLWEGTPATDTVEAVDRVFRIFDSIRSPGCAVGVARDGRTLLERAYGMADLEFRVANAPETVFEAGSVSKQFTAAAVVLLAVEGALSLDDDVRTHFPEIPDYGSTITIRHLLTHTSGLRDWGSIAAISGWSRSERTHDHDHVLQIISRQSALNYTAGTSYSYTNSGYNLLAMLVERVSGLSFVSFSHERLFQPLGLEHTQWRDDYRRIVPGRATAYSPHDGGFRINRPIEHVHGNGGLLTTVGDLLRWNEHLRTGTLGPDFMREMNTRGRLLDGSEIHYAAGLQFGEQNGHPRISHTGATSGYRAYLALFPEQELSVAVLCNTSSASPGELGGSVAAAFLPIDEAAGEDAQDVPEADTDEEELFQPTPEELAAFSGVYHSEDARTTLEVKLEADGLVILRAPASRFELEPSAAEGTFDSSLGEIHFVQEDGGLARKMRLSQPRVHDLRFRRVDR